MAEGDQLEVAPEVVGDTFPRLRVGGRGLPLAALGVAQHTQVVGGVDTWLINDVMSGKRENIRGFLNR